MINLSPFLRNLLLPKRVQFLFPAVWDILAPKYHKENLAVTGDKSHQECSISTNHMRWNPLMRNRLNPMMRHSVGHGRTWWFTEILKFRMVCRSWCNAVDNWYQNHPCHHNMSSNDISNHEYATIARIMFLAQDEIWVHNTEKDPMGPVGFMTHFEASHCLDGVATRNPFLGRDLSVSIDSFAVAEQQGMYLLNGVKSLFEIYGHQIWCLQLHLVDNFFNRGVHWYKSVGELLEHVPNLKVIRLSYHSPVSIRVSSELGTPLSPEELQQLQEYVDGNPLPKLDKLKSLITGRYLSPYMPTPLFNEFIRSYGSQVSTLGIYTGGGTDASYNVSKATVPNLRKLCLEIQSEQDFVSFFANNVDWPLKELDFKCHNSLYLEWQKVFTALEVNWAKPLTRMTLRLPSAEGMEERKRLLEYGGEIRLNLARLKHLRLTMFNVCSLDFLLPLKDTLEHLKLEMYLNSVAEEGISDLVKIVENGKVIQLWKVLDQPLDSNIWTLFPNLERMELVYHRIYGSDMSRLDRCGYSTWSLNRKRWKQSQNRKANVIDVPRKC